MQITMKIALACAITALPVSAEAPPVAGSDTPFEPGVFLTLDNGYFWERFDLVGDQKFKYEMESDVRGGKPRDKGGTYFVEKDRIVLVFESGRTEWREIRRINGIWTIWRDDAIQEWDRTSTYRLYGIAIRVDKNGRVREELAREERLWNRDVKGIRLLENTGKEILDKVPEPYRKHFVNRKRGSSLVIVDERWGGGRKMYEFDMNEDRLPVRQGLEISHFPGGGLESISCYERGFLCGPYFSFYKNGQLRFARHWEKEGSPGLFEQWNVNGMLTVRATYEQGKPADGTVLEVDWDKAFDTGYVRVTYKNGKKVEIRPCDEEGNVRRAWTPPTLLLTRPAGSRSPSRRPAPRSRGGLERIGMPALLCP